MVKPFIKQLFIKQLFKVALCLLIGFGAIVAVDVIRPAIVSHVRPIILIKTRCVFQAIEFFAGEGGLAFGDRDETLVTKISKKDFPPGVKVGGQIEGADPQGNRQIFTVVKIKGDTVILDGNHPLAGEDITFTLKVIDVKPASAEEIQHGHAHGAHGHHH
mgnify:CR=1 FL=1